MKRSKTSSRAMRALGDNKDRHGNSHYARKVAAGNQMYGSADKRANCCAHTVKLTYWAG